MCSASGDREWFLDLGYMEDFWGTVYYCNLCFDELARAAGYDYQEVFEKHKDDFDETLARWKYDKWELSGAVDILRAGGIDIRAFYQWITSVVNGETIVELPKREEPVVSRETRPVKSVNEQRSMDVPVFELNV